MNKYPEGLFNCLVVKIKKNDKNILGTYICGGNSYKFSPRYFSMTSWL